MASAAQKNMCHMVSVLWARSVHGGRASHSGTYQNHIEMVMNTST